MGICMSKTGLFLNPEIAVIGGTVTSIGFSGVTMEIQFQAQNPNPAELKATRMIYLLKKASDGTTLTEGVANEKFTLKASSTLKDIKIPMTFSYMGVGAAAKSIISRGKTKIQVSGEITFDAPMAPGGVATSKFEGEIDVDMENSSAMYK